MICVTSLRLPRRQRTEAGEALLFAVFALLLLGLSLALLALTMRQRLEERQRDVRRAHLDLLLDGAVAETLGGSPSIRASPVSRRGRTATARDGARSSVWGPSTRASRPARGWGRARPPVARWSGSFRVGHGWCDGSADPSGPDSAGRRRSSVGVDAADLRPVSPIE